MQKKHESPTDGILPEINCRELSIESNSRPLRKTREAL